MWLLYLVNGFQSSIVYNLIPFVTSDWESHSLLTVIYIVANAISAAVYIPLAKLLDIWGRAEGFLVMTTLATLGLILMATCQNLPMFSAAYVFYVVGFGGMTYCVDVITADVSKLKNRGLAYAFTSSPYMITAFAGAKASEGFYNNVSWRWAFGCFAIIFPFVAAPLFVVLKYNLKKAANRGLVGREKSGRSVGQSAWHYLKEFDGESILRNTTLIGTNIPSSWCFPVCLGPDRLPPAIHPCRQRSQRVVDRLHHCYDRRGVRRSRRLWSLRGIPGARSLRQLQHPDGSHRHRRLFVEHDVHGLLLLLELVLQLVPSGGQQPDPCRSRLCGKYL